MEAILNKLEYNKILEILSNYCKTYIGKNIAINLMKIKPYIKAQKQKYRAKNR